MESAESMLDLIRAQLFLAMAEVHINPFIS
jgi:hypothetical protein